MIREQYGYLGEDEDDNPAKFARLMDEIRDAIAAGNTGLASRCRRSPTSSRSGGGHAPRSPTPTAS